jgi:hypothetical protein
MRIAWSQYHLAGIVNETHPNKSKHLTLIALNVYRALFGALVGS